MWDKILQKFIAINPSTVLTFSFLLTIFILACVLGAPVLGGAGGAR